MAKGLLDGEWKNLLESVFGGVLNRSLNTCIKPFCGYFKLWCLTGFKSIRHIGKTLPNLFFL